ncbi:MAG TPA: hypothetical protein VIC62_00985 [Nakamurella sp.]|jgi:hypothetical protein
MTAGEPLSLPPPRRSGFLRHTVRIEPAGCRSYAPAEWQDCLVIVESGEVELEMTSGVRHTCRGGDILWLAGLPLRRLSNHGDEPVVITTVRRWQDGSRTEPEERQ